MRRYFIMAAAMVMLFAFTSCSTIINQARGETQAGIFTDLTDAANFWVEIDGVRYSVGDPVSVLIEGFYLSSHSQERLNGVLQANDSIYITFERAEGSLSNNFGAEVANTTDSDIFVHEGSIIAFNFTGADWGHDTEWISFIHGIQFNSTTYQEIIDMFGEPDDVWIQRGGHTKQIEYRSASGTYVAYQFTFDTNTGKVIWIILAHQ